jgi:proteasome assembly chaperone (PAC2) family protein
MSDSSIRWLVDRPAVDAPSLLVMLTGWIDAGGAGAAAMEAIETECAATPLATFDDDVYIDFRARRPTMQLREGLNSVLQWSQIKVSIGRDLAGHDLVLLTGPEPDMAWHRFSDAVGDLAVELGVTRMFGLGAYPFAAPHTRAPRISISTPSQDLLTSVRFMRSSVDVPAGVAASIEHAMHARGIPALGIWVQVPHYITSMAYPTSSVALLDALREVADITVDATRIRQEAVLQRGRLDKLVEDNPEHVQMLARLEELYDSIGDPSDANAGGPILEMRSGDELAAELEQFLREQD